MEAICVKNHGFEIDTLQTCGFCFYIFIYIFSPIVIVGTYAPIYF